MLFSSLSFYIELDFDEKVQQQLRRAAAPCMEARAKRHVSLLRKHKKQYLPDVDIATAEQQKNRVGILFALEAKIATAVESDYAERRKSVSRHYPDCTKRYRIQLHFREPKLAPVNPLRSLLVV